MFTQEEAASLLLAGKLAAPQTDASVQRQLEEALLKIKSVLRTADKEQLNELSERVQILSMNNPDEPHQKHLTALQQAVAANRLLFIRYESSYNKTETTERLVEPLGLLHYSNAWHLIGWCRLRNDYRDFKVNRISRLQLKDETVDVSKHKSLQEYINSIARNYELTEIVITVDKDIVKYMETNRRYYGFVREEVTDDKLRMYFLVAHPEPFARWLLMFTNSITVESPAMLKMFMEELTEELREHYLKK
jgi:predicted DNA-binding transcriptional regulator YafY